MEFVTTVCTLGAGVLSCIIENPAASLANVGMGVAAGMIANPFDRKARNQFRA
jgi:hypothetical protein